MEIRQLSRSGHSIVIALPRKYLAALNLRPRDYVTVALLDRALTVRRLETPAASALSADPSSSPAPRAGRKGNR